jgi:hypothetical protein
LLPLANILCISYVTVAAPYFPSYWHSLNWLKKKSITTTTSRIVLAVNVLKSSCQKAMKQRHLLMLVSHVSMSTAIYHSELNEVFDSIYGEVMLVVNICHYQDLLLPMALTYLVRVHGAGAWDMELNHYA